MSSSLVAKNIIIDTGFWFALYNSKDQYHTQANKQYESIKNFRIIIPWPSLYEVLNTEFMGNKIGAYQFEIFLKKQNVHRLDDAKYRENALIDTFDKSRLKDWKISLVDMVIRHILMDGRIDIDYLITYNHWDFHDILKKHPKAELLYA